MKQAIGGVTVFNIIIIFLITVFALLAAAYSYTKAYRINTRIMNGIEIAEGYNDTAVEYINYALEVFGYRRGQKLDCPATKVIDGQVGVLEENENNNHYYCVYYYEPQTERNGMYGGCYYSYAVVTYITADLPIVGRFELPIVSKTNRTFNFDTPKNNTAAIAVCK